MLKPPKTGADDQMDALIISFLLLLPCCVCLLDAEVTLVKRFGKEPVFIPICTNETSNILILMVCKIRTERSSGEECPLLYRDGGDFVHECDSRFTLKTRNHTVFLHLISLTPADSGNYTCECSNPNGTHILHLNVTVRDSFPNDNPADEVRSDSAGVALPSALTAAVLFIILLTVILGFVHRRRHHREQPKSCSHHKNEDLVEIEPYSTFIQKENGLYASGILYDHQINSDKTNMFT